MIKNWLKIALAAAVLPGMIACNSGTTSESSAGSDAKIVSLNGTLTEILYGLGMEENLVGVDVTSTYPEAADTLPKVGHTHNLNTEAILALQPDYVLSMEERGIKPEQAEQLRQAGVKVWVITQDYSTEGTRNLINQVADSFGREAAAQQMIASMEQAIASAPEYTTEPSVLFIYARGAGTLQVAGSNTPMDKMITLAGGRNVAADLENFQPLTAESLIKMNPDYILLFDSGLRSLEGPEGLLNVPGVAETRAGREKNFVVMDGALLSGFGPRLGEAVLTLGKAIHKP